MSGPEISPRIPRQVLTFDAGGVSGHPNHAALPHAMANLVAAGARAGGRGSRPRVWLLQTTSLLRKYLGLLDLPLSFLLLLLATARPGRSMPRRMVLNFRPWVAYWAMLAHASQFVWYRRLFILLSRYTYVNTLVPMENARGHR